jgi:hypothetical protein
LPLKHCRRNVDHSSTLWVVYGLMNTFWAQPTWRIALLSPP